jgi:calcium homeostasis ER protein
MLLGWEGAGLGTKGQGIQAPIPEAESRNNQYAGVGSSESSNLFEKFRRNKSYTYNRRTAPSNE